MSYLAEGNGPDFKQGQHCERIPPVTTVFYGKPKVFFLAICMDCNAPGGRPMPMPFGTEAERDRWADGHRTTGHQVEEAMEVRP